MADSTYALKVKERAMLSYRCGPEGGPLMPTESSHGSLVPSTQNIAQRGEQIYREKYEEGFVKIHRGRFAAINVNTTEATVSDSADEAVRLALQKDPDGLFHLIRIAHQAAFEAGWFMSCGL
jgi:hypothetical protein